MSQLPRVLLWDCSAYVQVTLRLLNCGPKAGAVMLLAMPKASHQVPLPSEEMKGQEVFGKRDDFHIIFITIYCYSSILLLPATNPLLCLNKLYPR